MRWIVGIGCLLVSGLAAHGQESSEAKAETPAVSLLDNLLNQWEQRGSSETLDASFTRVDRATDSAAEVQFEGRILVKKPCFALIHLDRVSNEKRSTQERTVWDGKRIYQYLGDTQQIWVYPLPAGEERLGPPSDGGLSSFARMYMTLVPMFNSLHGDHLPLMLDMNVAEAKRFYRMSLEEDVTDFARIKLVPLTVNGESDPSGETATLRLDKKTYLPREIELESPNHKNRSLYKFTRITRNVALNEQNFQFRPLRGWKVMEFPSIAELQGGSDAPRRTTVR
jgi:outer membrane lipoprotein-sorting protein